MLALDEEIADIGARVEAMEDPSELSARAQDLLRRLREHRDAEILLSMPGIGPLLGAEFIAGTGGDMYAFGTAGRPAGVAGLALVSRDSGRISGNMHRPHCYHRRLLRVLYLSAQIGRTRPSGTRRGTTPAQGPLLTPYSRRARHRAPQELAVPRRFAGEVTANSPRSVTPGVTDQGARSQHSTERPGFLR